MPRPYSSMEQSGDGYSDDGFDQEGSRGFTSPSNRGSSTPNHAASRQSLASQHQSHDEYEDSKFEEPAPQGPSKWAQEALPDEETIKSLQALLRQRRLGGGASRSAQQQQGQQHPKAGSHTVRRGRNSLASINTDYAGSSVPSAHVPADTALDSSTYQRACQVARQARGEGVAPRSAQPSPRARRPSSARRSADQEHMDRLSAPKWHPEGWGTAQAALVPEVRAMRKQFPFKPTIPKASRKLAARTSNGAPFLERLEQHERERLSRLATQKATIQATGAGAPPGKAGKSSAKWSDESWQRVRQQQEERQRKIAAQREALYGDLGRPLTRWTDTDERAAAPPVAWDEVKDDFLARMDEAAASKHELREALAEKGRAQHSRL